MSKPEIRLHLDETNKSERIPGDEGSVGPKLETCRRGRSIIVQTGNENGFVPVATIFSLIYYWRSGQYESCMIPVLV